MSIIIVTGTVTDNPEMKHSQRGNPYIRFNLMEQIGFRDSRRNQFFQVWAWGENAVMLNSTKVSKGMRLEVTGSLELEIYTKANGLTDKRLKVALENWSFSRKESRCGNETVLPQKSADNTANLPIDSIDGDNDSLPE